MTTNRKPINESDLIRPPKFIRGGMYEVDEGWCAVVTEGGVFKELIDPGTYRYDFPDNVKISLVNTKVNTLDVSIDQEFTISAGPNLDIPVVIDLEVTVEYQAKDPRLVATVVSEPLKNLFDIVRQVLRSSTANVTIIELQNQGDGISQSTMQKLQAFQLPELFGIEISKVQVTRLSPSDTTSNRFLLEDDPIAFRNSSTEEKRIQFSVYHPIKIAAESWSTLLAYVHLKNAIMDIQDDAQGYLDKLKEFYDIAQIQSPVQIPTGSEIIVVPHLEGCQFNPPQSSVLFLENWHRIIFRVRPKNSSNGISRSIVKGKITFFVGAVIIAEIDIWAKIDSETETAIGKTEILETTNPYQSVFVSYAHSDVEIIEYLENAYKVLGIQYLRDVHFLRSGEKWNEKILNKIEEADIFQLCWSENAKDSQYVKQEWEHALEQDRNYFIRPVYWEKPLPEPPKELAELHFAYLDISKLNKTP